MIRFTDNLSDYEHISEIGAIEALILVIYQMPANH